MFESMIETLKANPRKIVFTEGPDARILEAASRLKKDGFLTPILVGNVEEVTAAAKAGVPRPYHAPPGASRNFPAHCPRRSISAFLCSLFVLLFSLKKQGSPSGEPWLVNSLNGQTGSDTAARRSPSLQEAPDGSPAR